MTGEQAWQVQILDVIRYGLLLQHPSHLEEVTSRENANPFFFFIVALRPRKRDGLLGTGTEWEWDDRVKARPRKPPENDRRDRGPPPEQWKC